MRSGRGRRRVDIGRSVGIGTDLVVRRRRPLRAGWDSDTLSYPPLHMALADGGGALTVPGLTAQMKNLL